MEIYVFSSSMEFLENISNIFGFLKCSIIFSFIFNQRDVEKMSSIPQISHLTQSVIGTNVKT